jgi:hypothetical protein
LNEARARALQIAAGISYSFLTDDQIKLLVAEEAGMSPAQRLAFIMTILPPQAARTQILLPYLTQGSLAEFPLRGHDLTTFVFGQMSTGTADMRSIAGVSKIPSGVAAKETYESALKSSANIKRSPAPIGSKSFYDEWKGFGPDVLRQVGDSLTPMSLWASTGLTPDALGVGMAGMTEVKGKMAQAMASALQAPVAARASADADIVDAGAAAARLDDVDY